jgi:hypothetical protein
MKRLLPILILLVLVCAVIVPASAVLTPNTFAGAGITGFNSTSFIHDVNYLPVEFVYAFIILGFFTMIVSQAIIRYGMMYAILSPIAFGLAAWYSNYMTQETVNAVYSCALDLPVVVHTEVITPSPAFAVFLVVCFLVSFINVFVIYFINRAPIEQKEPEGSEKSSEDE